ncbi:zinc finger protein 518B [Anomaloglossus baeobatrachus]|uniref:zinc finger protein 518B n=1 Tax=Anomaloglossus baeobatrachus TaxID=238106 RepID=UPI003F4F754B
MDSSFSVASFPINQSSQNNKYVTQGAFFCQKAINGGTESIMNNLMQQQIGEKFNCEKCRFSTKDSNKYRNHVTLHNDIKYACSHCEFVSYTKTEFQRHLVTHTGKFPFTCGYCGYGAIRNDYIVKHIRRIHGDGKIQCSVSTVENESKKASINIMQTQVIAPNAQSILENRPPSTGDIIDLTSEVDSLGSNINTFSSNGNNPADDLEVKVISPVDQKLYPWTPLSVAAPTSFKVPPNCIAEVMEVKSVNSACHLVLKFLNLVNPGVANQPSKNEEPNHLKPIIPSKNPVENPFEPTLQECAVLCEKSQENILIPSKPVCKTEESAQPKETCPIDNTNEIINAVEESANEIFDDLEEFSGGPIISSVFSLSSDSQNLIEGINWDCPNTSPSNEDIDSTCSSLKPPSSEEPPSTCSSESNCQMDIDKSQDLLGNTASEKEQSEVPKEKAIQHIDAEIQLSVKSVSTDVQDPESQPSALLQDHMEGGRRSSRLSKLEISNFTKPQALFLSCDKRIVMQPLSCTMQNDKMTSSHVDEVKKKLQVFVKMRRESAKARVKRLVAPAVKSAFQPNLRTLRLRPVKADQAHHIPSYNQPVIVLNHPDVETIAISYIMKGIRLFRGKIAKITLSKQMFKKCV